MKELLRTTDPVLISWLTATLRGAGIEPVILDTHMSILEGSIGILPRRIMVADRHHGQAESILRDRPDHNAADDGRGGNVAG